MLNLLSKIFPTLEKVIRPSATLISTKIFSPSPKLKPYITKNVPQLLCDRILDFCDGKTTRLILSCMHLFPPR